MTLCIMSTACQPYSCAKKGESTEGDNQAVSAPANAATVAWKQTADRTAKVANIPLAAGTIPVVEKGIMESSTGSSPIPILIVPDAPNMTNQSFSVLESGYTSVLKGPTAVTIDGTNALMVNDSSNVNDDASVEITTTEHDKVASFRRGGAAYSVTLDCMGPGLEAACSSDRRIRDIVSSMKRYEPKTKM